jgi:hypothetical protein
MPRLLAVLAGLVLVPVAHGVPSASCRFDDVSFSSQFEGARLSDCKRLGERAFELLIEPESVPINDSAWYAFRLDFDEDAELRPLKLRLRYDDGTHRYRPKLLVSGSDESARWQVIPPDRVELGEQGRWSTFELHPSSRSFTISAQPLLTNTDHRAFVRTMAEHDAASLEALGQSVEGRPIEALRIGNVEVGVPTIVLLGRQHPPEVPGALALQAFIRELLSESKLARRFRSALRVIAVPNLNPDGVARGHWRLNANHRDLNRDWGPFTQPETRMVGDRIEAIGPPRRDGGVWLLLDFHSTRRDVFYTQLEQPEFDLSSFTRCWLDRIDEDLPDYEVARAPRHLVDGTTAKAWATRVLGAPAVTYEVGDATELGTVDRVAQTAAQTLMRTMLQARQQGAGGCDSVCTPCEGERSVRPESSESAS